MSKNFRITSRDGSRHVDAASGVSVHNRISFKNSRNQNRNRGMGNFRKFNAPVSLLKLMEDDICMDGMSNKNNNNNPRPSGGRYRGGRGGGGQFPRLGQSEVPFSKSGWYKVTIPHARDLKQDFILKSINGLINVPMSPFNFHFEDKFAVFNIKGATEAGAIKEVSRRVTTPNGFKMIIMVSPCPAPPTDINAEVLAKIKESMGKRYKTDTFLLDLSAFAKDPELLQQNINISMSRPKVINSMLEIISQNIPWLKALDLSNNELQNLNILSSLHEKAPQLVSLNLAQNRITSESDLVYIKKLKLEELMLEGNPVQSRYKDKQLYIRAVRQKFPNVLRLDGQQLPPPINFNIEPVDLPTSKGSYYFDNELIRNQVCLFVKEYLREYDSDNRERLIGAYHEEATFSMTCHYNRAQNNPAQSNMTLVEYLKFNRNLKRVENSEKLVRIRSGRDNIINLLKKLPSTNHDPDPNSFIVDVTLITPSMIIFSVTGVFTEVTSPNARSKPMRHFNRLIVAVPNGDGIAILNEMLTVTNLNAELFEKYKTEIYSSSSSKKSQETSSSLLPATQQPPPSSSSSSTSLIPQIHDLTQLQREMTATFSLKSGMNEHYSIMCLSGNNWNFEEAAKNFSELHQANGIPAEAFIK